MGKKQSIIIGETYGNLTVLEYIGFNKSRHQFYRCVCTNCKKESKVSRATLMKNAPKCMICKGRDIYPGLKKNGYVVLEKKRDEKNNIWICKCEKCNRKVEIKEKDLIEKNFPKCKCVMYPSLQKSYIDQIF